MKKWTRRLIKFGIISAILLPMAIYGLIKLMPYINVTSLMHDPEAMVLRNMILVDREYNFTIEQQFSLSNSLIEMDFEIWDIIGIYFTNEYQFTNRTNYFAPNVFINGEDINLNSNPLPNHNYSNENQLSISTTAVNTSHNILAVYGVWNTSDHIFPNLYNESEGAFFSGNIINFSTPVSQVGTPLWIYYESDQVPLIIEYYHKNWTSLIFQLDLKIINNYNKEMILPSANFTVAFLEGLLGNGWISQDYYIPPKSTQIIPSYLKVENTRIFQTFFTSLLTGIPMDLKANFEAYIRINGLLYNLPFFSIIFPTVIDFPTPPLESNQPPIITFINRSAVFANQPVTVTINATDKGAGISNRTYLRYSTNNGLTWNNITMSGGRWINSYLGSPLSHYYPIPSILGNDTYQAQIPGLPANTNVLFKIYLEDYAGNVDHIKTANWMESENYNYTVPDTTPLPEFVNYYDIDIEQSFFQRYFKYMEANGMNLDAFLMSQGFDLFALLPLIGGMADYFYANDVDVDYVLGLLFVAFDLSLGIMEDSGVPLGALIKAFNLDLTVLCNYLMDHLHLPLNDNIAELANNTSQNLIILDDMEGAIGTNWVPNATGIVSEELSNILNVNGENIGIQSLNWTTNTLEIISRDFGSNIISIKENDIMSFWLDYSDYNLINGNFSVILIDNQSNLIQSSPIYFENIPYGNWQEISLNLNSTNFTISPDFNFNAVQKVQLLYLGNSTINIFIDYLCIYSPTIYESYQFFTYDLKLTNEQIDTFLQSSFIAITLEPIIPDVDWEVNNSRMSYWNLLSLLKTSNDTNYHSAAANLLLEELGVPNSFGRLTNAINGQFIPAGSPILDTDIYPYTSTFVAIMLYLGLAYVSYQAIKKEYRKRAPKKEEILPMKKESEKLKEFDKPPIEENSTSEKYSNEVL